MQRRTARKVLFAGTDFRTRVRNSLFSILMLLVTIVGFGAAAAASSAADSDAFTESQGRQILEISVFRNGNVFAGGSKRSLAKIDDLFGVLKSVDGAVWYYREGPETSASVKSAEAVMDLVIKHRLPICLSEAPDFSVCKE